VLSPNASLLPFARSSTLVRRHSLTSFHGNASSKEFESHKAFAMFTVTLDSSSCWGPCQFCATGYRSLLLTPQMPLNTTKQPNVLRSYYSSRPVSIFLSLTPSLNFFVFPCLAAYAVTNVPMREKNCNEGGKLIFERSRWPCSCCHSPPQKKEELATSEDRRTMTVVSMLVDLSPKQVLETMKLSACNVFRSCTMHTENERERFSNVKH